MPPTTRRMARLLALQTASDLAHTNHFLQFSLFGPCHMPIGPSVPPSSRRAHSPSSSPYPTSRQAINQARTSARKANVNTTGVLDEIDWWLRMSGQRDEDEDEYDEEEEWETWPEEQAQEVEATAPSAPVDTISHNDNHDDDTISECSDAAETLHSDSSTLVGYEVPDYGDKQPRGSTLLCFPTSFPPLANLLNAQVGSEPSRASRSDNRLGANVTTTLTWDYSTSSMMITSVTPPNPTPLPPSPDRTTICRSANRRPSKDAVAAAAARKKKAKCARKAVLDFLPLKKFPMEIFSQSPSVLTFR